MLEIDHFPSLCVQFRLQIDAFKKKIWAEDYAAETFYISNFKSNNEYVVRLFKLVFLIILVFFLML